jgi:uncharacterized membrane protein
MNIVEIGQQFTPWSSFLWVFIGFIVVLWIILIIYSLRKDGWCRTIRFFVPMMIAAAFIESSGVVNGRFFYPNYLIYVAVLGGGVPLVILMGWSTNLYIFLRMGILSVTPFFKNKNVLQIGLISCAAAVFGVCLDALEDPLAHHLGWWVWTNEASGVLLFGVPLLNYVDWVIILIVMSFVTVWIEYTDYSEKHKVLLSFFSLPIVLGVIIVLHLGVEGLLSMSSFI